MSELNAVETDVVPLDLIEELRLRRWARRNYVPAERRAGEWHPVVLDEMRARDRETRLGPSSWPAAALAGVQRTADTSARELLLPVPEVIVAVEEIGDSDGTAGHAGSIARRIGSRYAPLPPTHVSITHSRHEVPPEPNLARVESPAVEWST